MIPVFRNIDSPNGDFGLVKQEGDERFVVLTVEEYAALRETEARANTAKVAADLMRARAERAEALVTRSIAACTWAAVASKARAAVVTVFARFSMLVTAPWALIAASERSRWRTAFCGSTGPCIWPAT